MTCSRKAVCRAGAPRGLGTPPDTGAIRLPLPAARIKHSLTVVIGPPQWIGVFRKEAAQAKGRSLCFSLLRHLPWQTWQSCRKHALSWGRNRNTRCFTSVVPKNMGFCDALRRAGKPEKAIFLVDLDEVRALRPERRVFCRLALCARQCVILRVYPDAAAE